jgi:hypothetical protein
VKKVHEWATRKVTPGGYRGDHFLHLHIRLPVKRLRVRQRYVFANEHTLHSLCRNPQPMIRKSKQRRAEENKTASITGLATLRFKMLKPYEGIIELVNSSDQGRICSLRVSDFASVEDAQVYGQLMVMAPQLLSAALNDAEELLQVVKRFKQYRALMEKKKQKRAVSKKRNSRG